MNQLTDYETYLYGEEKSTATREKYLRDTAKFLLWLGQKALTKTEVLAYKTMLTEAYSPASVNSMLSSVNSYLVFLGREDCRVKTVKQQREIFYSEDRELTREEYLRLLHAAEADRRLWLLIQAICATGIRVSEHCYLTVEAARQGKAVVRCKGKIRTILIPRKLCRGLLDYCRQQGIVSGCIFLNTAGKPLDRSRIWAMMKRLCAASKVPPRKVFPHNLRHLFARMYYAIEKDIVRLADLLGHSSINTTRIYTRESGEEHRRQIEKMSLLVIT